MDAKPTAQPSEFLTELARLGETRTWEPGATVVTQGEPADCLYVVHEGELRTVVAGEGGRVVELSTMHGGEFFGELMLDGDVRSATVQVTQRARLTRVTRAQVELLLAKRPDLAIKVIQRLTHLVRALTQTTRNLASADVYSRLVGLFDALATDVAGRRVVTGQLTQQRIAERVGASKAMVNRLLQDLERGGYIEVSRERIVLLKKLPPRW